MNVRVFWENRVNDKDAIKAKTKIPNYQAKKKKASWSFFCLLENQSSLLVFLRLSSYRCQKIKAKKTLLNFLIVETENSKSFSFVSLSEVNPWQKNFILVYFHRIKKDKAKAKEPLKFRTFINLIKFFQSFVGCCKKEL